MLKTLKIAFLLCLPIVVKAQQNTILEEAQKHSKFSRFVRLIDESGVAQKLNGKGPYTLFIPTNQAMQQVGEQRIKKLEQSHGKLRNFILNHLLTGMATARQIELMDSAPTMGGSTLHINFNGNALKINGATLTQTNIHANNGIIHAINKVLVDK